MPIPVVQLVDGFATEEHSGGAALFAIQLARRLPRERWAPRVVGLWRYGTRSERRWLELLRDEGITTAVLVDAPRGLGLDLVRASALLESFTGAGGTALINSHFERGDLLALSARLRRPHGLRIVRTQHTEQQWQTRPWLGRLLNLTAFPSLFDAEVAISMLRAGTWMPVRRRGCLAGAPSCCTTVSAATCSSGWPGRWRSSSHPPRVMVVGRLEEQKGHAYFIRACAEVYRERKEVEFWVVGAGPLQEPLRALAAELGLAAAVRFWGRRDDVPELLPQADVLVSSSLWEGFPTVLLEAMAARLPVVATDVSGSRELVRDGRPACWYRPAMPGHWHTRSGACWTTPIWRGRLGAARRVTASASRSSALPPATISYMVGYSISITLRKLARYTTKNTKDTESLRSLCPCVLCGEIRIVSTSFVPYSALVTSGLTGRIPAFSILSAFSSCPRALPSLSATISCSPKWSPITITYSAGLTSAMAK